MLRNEYHFLTHVDEIAPRPVDPASGWRDVNIRFLLPEEIAEEGVCLFRTIFPAGAAHEKHYHPNAGEFLYVLRGRAGIGGGDEETEVGAGAVQIIHPGKVHWLRNLSNTEEVEVVGGYLGVRSLEEAGYEFVAHLETVG